MSNLNHVYSLERPVNISKDFQFTKYALSFKSEGGELIEVFLTLNQNDKVVFSVAYHYTEEELEEAGQSKNDSDF